MVIFAVGVLVAATLSRDLTALNRDARVRSEAAGVGLQMLDSLATLAYDDFAVGATVAGIVTVEGVNYSRSFSPIQFGPRTIEVQVKVVPPTDDGLTCLGTTFCAKMYVVEEW
jgi:hypothetical protein